MAKRNMPGKSKGNQFEGIKRQRHVSLIFVFPSDIFRDVGYIACPCSATGTWDRAWLRMGEVKSFYIQGSVAQIAQQIMALPEEVCEALPHLVEHNVCDAFWKQNKGGLPDEFLLISRRLRRQYYARLKDRARKSKKHHDTQGAETQQWHDKPDGVPEGFQRLVPENFRKNSEAFPAILPIPNPIPNQNQKIETTTSRESEETDSRALTDHSKEQGTKPKPKPKAASKKDWIGQFFREVEAPELPQGFDPTKNAYDALVLFAREYRAKYGVRSDIVRGKHLQMAQRWVSIYGQELPLLIAAFFKDHFVRWVKDGNRLTVEVFNVEIGKVKLPKKYDEVEEEPVEEKPDEEDQSKEDESEEEFSEESAEEVSIGSGDARPVNEKISRKRIWGKDWEVRNQSTDDEAKNEILDRLIPEFSKMHSDVTGKGLLSPRVKFDWDDFKRGLRNLLDSGMALENVLMKWEDHIQGGGDPMSFYDSLRNEGIETCAGSASSGLCDTRNGGSQA